MKFLNISILKTVFINWRYLKTIKPIIIISRGTLLKIHKNSKIIVEKPEIGSVKIGFGEVGFFDKRSSKTILDNKNTIIFKGKSSIGKNSKVISEGNLEFGNNFTVTASTKIWCKNRIVFGDNCLVSWDTLFMDTDGHKIFDANGEQINKDAPIIIGDKVWIGSNCIIQKGTQIEAENIIANNSKISGKKLNSRNTIYGNNGVILKKDISWES